MELPIKKMADRGEIEPAEDKACYQPDVDIYRSEEGVVLLADLPGVDKESLDIHVEEGVLTLSGKVNSSAGDYGELKVGEFELGDFHRSFRLGPDVDQAKLEAKLEDGVLRLSIPKSDWAKTRKIEVK